jgi:hypothetical protein
MYIRNILGCLHRTFNKAVVRPLLKHACCVWSPPHAMYQERLERVQSYATLKIKLAWPSLERREFQQMSATTSCKGTRSSQPIFSCLALYHHGCTKTANLSFKREYELPSIAQVSSTALSAAGTRCQSRLFNECFYLLSPKGTKSPSVGTDLFSFFNYALH